MMELFLHVIGTQEIISLSLVGKTASTEYGILMEDNFIVPNLMIMSLLALNGLLMEISLLLDHLRC